jgi:CheY-like chemotaxis protein
VPTRILLIDDDAAFRYATEKVLSDAAYDVVCAKDYLSALDILGQEPKINLLLTDIAMPGGMNGFALARMAKVRQRDLKILYITAFDVPTDEAIGTVLRKPVDDTTLLDEIQKTLAA